MGTCARAIWLDGLRACALAAAILLAGPAAAGAARLDDGIRAFEDEAYATAREIFEPLAERGDPEAQTRMGLLLEMGLGGETERAREEEDFRARRWYRKAAEQGHKLAQHSLGSMYLWGIGGVKDPESAADWLERAAEQGVVEAQVKLAALYADGRDVRFDLDKAVAWLRTAADRDDPLGQFLLAPLYEAGMGVPNDLAAAVQLYRRAAEQGHAKAQLTLAKMYAEGRGVERDDTEAVAWLKRAGARGNADALERLGVRYAEGLGVPKDTDAALVWFDKAAAFGAPDRVARKLAHYGLADRRAAGGLADADRAGPAAASGLGPTDYADFLPRAALSVQQGYHEVSTRVLRAEAGPAALDAAEGLRRAAERDDDADAQNRLGWLHEHGQGVAQTYAVAFDWYYKAAVRHSHAWAQYNLGQLYLRGLGVKRDPQEAAKWLRRAAAAGLAAAEHDIAVLYFRGWGVTQNYRRAAIFFRRAAEQGLARSQYAFGLMQYYGVGVSRTCRESLAWLKRAGDQGHADALARVGTMYAEGRLILADGGCLSRDFAKARLWFRRAAAHGHPEAPARLRAGHGLVAVTGHGAAPDADPAARAAAAAAADPSAQPAFTPPANPYGVAVIVGNRDYAAAPDVDYAHADADAVRGYVRRVLGVRPGNILDLRDVGLTELRTVFGSAADPRGDLYWTVKPGESEVFVFYSGHGVPDLGEGGARGYLLPVDARPETPGLGGYPLDLLYRNLEKLPATRVTVLLDACFSGLTQAGTLVPQTSGAFGVAVAAPEPETQLAVLTATAFDRPQYAHWLPDKGHGAFTYYALKGLYGAADKDGYGSRDGRVTLAEVKAYLDDEMRYQVRRSYRRDQTASLLAGEGADLTLSVFPDPDTRPRSPLP